jgi:pimeloyl-ACP methyl ester carboxylesterase
MQDDLLVHLATEPAVGAYADGRCRASRGRTSTTIVQEFPGWTDELRSLQVPTLLIFGDRDFSPLPDVLELFELLPNAQLAVLPRTSHVGVTRRSGEV